MSVSNRDIAALFGDLHAALESNTDTDAESDVIRPALSLLSIVVQSLNSIATSLVELTCIVDEMSDADKADREPQSIGAEDLN